MDISHVFDVEDLLPYRGTFEPSTLPSSVSAGEASKGAPTMPSFQDFKEMVDIILNGEFVTSRDGCFRHFLVKWHGRPDSDATWIHKDDLRLLDPSLLDRYLSSHSLESSCFQLGRNDRAWNRPIFRPKQDRKPKFNDDCIIISYLFNYNFWIYLFICLIVLFWIYLLAFSISAYK